MPKTYPVPCTKEEIDALITASMDNDLFFTLFSVAKTTGRRLGELFELKVKDIDFEKGIMMTKILKRGKRVEKEAVLTPEALRLLQRYVRKNSLRLDHFVFDGISYRGIQRAVTRYAKKAEISHAVSFHNFRHYFITHLLKKGWNYNKVAKLTGHGNPATIVNYDHMIASDVRDEAIKDLAGI